MPEVGCIGPPDSQKSVDLRAEADQTPPVRCAGDQRQSTLGIVKSHAQKDNRPAGVPHWLKGPRRCPVRPQGEKSLHERDDARGGGCILCLRHIHEPVELHPCRAVVDRPGAFPHGDVVAHVYGTLRAPASACNRFPGPRTRSSADCARRASTPSRACSRPPAELCASTWDRATSRSSSTSSMQSPGCQARSYERVEILRNDGLPNGDCQANTSTHTNMFRRRRGCRPTWRGCTAAERASGPDR